MSIAVNGQSLVPPGFRFHPTEEELLNYYLKKKVACEKIDLDVIRDVDLNKLEPWDIQEKCRIGSTPQNDWYFFSHKDKKYPAGTRTNRATAAGFWKATGRDKVIYSSCKRIGMRKTLVFYRGRAPHGQKSDWIMHEYRLDDHCDSNSVSNGSSSVEETIGQEEGWVVCRVFKKKDYHKASESPDNSSNISHYAKATTNTKALPSSSDGAPDQILQYMGKSCKQESDNISGMMKSAGYSRYHHLPIIETGLMQDRFMKLPVLESPTLPSLSSTAYTPFIDLHSQTTYQHEMVVTTVADEQHVVNDWATLDRLVASHLNGQSEVSKQLDCVDHPESFAYSPSSPNIAAATIRLLSSSGESDGDLWSFTRSVSPSSEKHCSLSQSSI